MISHYNNPTSDLVHFVSRDTQTHPGYKNLYDNSEDMAQYITQMSISNKNATTNPPGKIHHQKKELALNEMHSPIIHPTHGNLIDSSSLRRHDAYIESIKRLGHSIE